MVCMHNILPCQAVMTHLVRLESLIFVNDDKTKSLLSKKKYGRKTGRSMWGIGEKRVEDGEKLVIIIVNLKTVSS